MFCPECGSKLPAQSKFCFACGRDVSGIDLTPATGLSSVPVSATVAPSRAAVPAGFWLRVLALIIDTVLLFVNAAFWILVVQPFSSPDADPTLPVAVLMVAVAPILYYSYRESSDARATFGKAAVGIVVTDLDGRQLSFSHALLRSVSKLVCGAFTLSLGNLLAAVSPRKRALHDYLAGTVVVKQAHVQRAIDARMKTEATF